MAHPKFDSTIEKTPTTSTKEASLLSQSAIQSVSGVVNGQPLDSLTIAFELPKDPENPKDWSGVRKWVITFILSATGFNRILVSTIMAPALPAIEADLHMNKVTSLMSMSVYLLATTVAPLVFAPLSEIYGRKPVLHATNIWFLLWNIVCGFVKSRQLLLTARFFAGLGAGAAYILSGSVTADIWDAKDRGRTLGFSSLLANLAAAIGPIMGAFVTANTTWRWIFWSTSLFQAVIVIASLIGFRETYAPLLLQRKAERIHETRGDTSVQQKRAARQLLAKSLTRPLRLLLFHPIVLIDAVVAGFLYGICYLVITTYSDIWTTKYYQSLEISGLHYIAMCIGSVLGAQIGGPLMDFTFGRLTQKAGGKWVPEFHLPIMLPGAVFTAVGLFWYGWSAQKTLFWLNVDAGSAILSFGSQLTGIPLTAYVIDAYPEYASSAQAAAQVLRSLAAFGFPLFAPPLYSAAGYGWGNTMLAIVSLIISIPAAVLIWIYGARLRSQSSKAL